MHREPTLRIGHRRMSVSPSYCQAFRDHLKENTPRTHEYSVFVAPIQAAKLPATSVIQIFDKAVSSAGVSMCLNRAAAVLPSQPNGLQIPLAPVGGLHEPTCDQALCSLHRAEAEGCSVWSVVGDLFGGLHPGTLRVRQGREGVLRESRLSVVGVRDLREAPRASGGTSRRRSTQSLTRYHGRVKEKTNRCRVVFERRCRDGSRGPHVRAVNEIVSVS